jgi:hypothetical protein
MAEYQYPIKRANDTHLRKQIMEALDDLFTRQKWSLVKNTIEVGESLTVPAGYELVTHSRTFDVEGTLDLEGTLYVLGDPPVAAWGTV